MCFSFPTRSTHFVEKDLRALFTNRPLIWFPVLFGPDSASMSATPKNKRSDAREDAGMHAIFDEIRRLYPDQLDTHVQHVSVVKYW